MKKIAIFGGSFNPPGIHHRQIVLDLLEYFDQLIIFPCGPRPDKLSTNDIDPIHRAAMIDLTFGDLDKTQINLSDLENKTFTRTHDIDQHYKNVFGSEAEIWHIVGTDIIIGGAKQQSYIHQVWHLGDQLWNKLNFAVINRQGYLLNHQDLPPKSQIFKPKATGASTTIRDRIFHHQDFDELVVSKVADYIKRYGLYRGLTPENKTTINLHKIHAKIIYDQWNEQAIELAKQLDPIKATNGTTNLIIVIGGDGTMLRAIKDYWHLRIPFFGINTGHLGFLLNDYQGNDPIELIKNQDITFWHLPLLYSETETEKSQFKSGFAFNDARAERATGQTGWFKVSVNGKQRIDKLAADMILVSTAAGSTAYARSIGAPPIPVGTPSLLLVTSNIATPNDWQKVVNLSLDSEITIEALDIDKRPLRAFLDNQDMGRIKKMTIRSSRIAAIELGFIGGQDMMEKLLTVQFPKFSPEQKPILTLTNRTNTKTS